MADNNMFNEHMLEMFIFESNQLMEQLEGHLLSIESSSSMSEETINEIFRIMHTVKGSSAMMMLDNIAKLTHNLEDLFFYIRENNVVDVNFDMLCEIGFETIDFVGKEIAKLENKQEVDGNPVELQEKIADFLLELKGEDKKEDKPKTKKPKKVSKKPTKSKVKKETGSNQFKAIVTFEEGCGMENIRAFTVVRNLTDLCDEITHIPEDLIDGEDISEDIIESGFIINISSKESYKVIEKILKESLFVEKIELEEVKIEEVKEKKEKEEVKVDVKKEINKELEVASSKKKNIVSVNVEKMDKLMDLVGEIIITEVMVTNNPDLEGKELDNFNKAARQLRKLNNELQDVVMSIRMIPIGTTFHKMHRIVRDMNKKLGKNVELIISGEETEVDKNIIDSLGDPLMHLIRNALDHGIENNDDRKKAKKSVKGKVHLEALNNGGEIIIRIKDDGKGLDREKLLIKARDNNLLKKPEEEMSDKEVYALILLPGFSTNKAVTQFSGRGVGMDVVKKSIDKLGGSVSIESEKGVGTTISIKIPLTLAIIDGMKVSIGQSIFTLPITSIRESLKAVKKDIIKDSSNNEMVMIREDCYPIVRLHTHFKIETKIVDIVEGILILVETEEGSYCVFADDIIGEQQVVVKPIPKFLNQYQKSNSGVAGCAILGDANISIILDVVGLRNQVLS